MEQTQTQAMPGEHGEVGRAPLAEGRVTLPECGPPKTVTARFLALASWQKSLKTFYVVFFLLSDAETEGAPLVVGGAIDGLGLGPFGQPRRHLISKRFQG